jgi:hypothetical protein
LGGFAGVVWVALFSRGVSGAGAAGCSRGSGLALVVCLGVEGVFLICFSGGRVCPSGGWVLGRWGGVESLMWAWNS